MIALIGISLAISPPVPFCSLVAFVAIFAMAIGLLNDDDVYVIIGYVSALIYFGIVVGLLKIFSVIYIMDWIRKLFS